MCSSVASRRRCSWTGRRTDLRARHGEGELRAHAVDRRGHRTALPAALVLVAHQRVERDRRDGELLPRRARLLHRAQERRLEMRRHTFAARHRRRDDGRVGGDDAPHRADRRRDARDVLPARAPAGSRLGTGARAKPACRRRRTRMAQALLGWVLGCTFVYSALFGAGSYLYGRTTQGAVWTVVFVISCVGLIRVMSGLWREQELIR